VRLEQGTPQDGTHIADLWADRGVIAQAASDILHRLAGLHLRQLLVYVELVSESAPSETLILSVAACVNLVLQLQPVRELAMHGGFPTDLAELVPEIVEIFQGEVVLQDAFKKERVTNRLSEPGEIGQICLQLFVRDTGLDMTLMLSLNLLSRRLPQLGQIYWRNGKLKATWRLLVNQPLLGG
jgi:hypothetical protein